jgi:hypothetical protein
LLSLWLFNNHGAGPFPHDFKTTGAGDGALADGSPYVPLQYLVQILFDRHCLVSRDTGEFCEPRLQLPIARRLLRHFGVQLGHPRIKTDKASLKV